MRAAFVERFGPRGVCLDVGALITDLLRCSGFLSRVRAHEPIRWLDSELGRAVAAARGDVVELDAAMFHALDESATPFATALFVQWLEASADAEGWRIVLNGAQAGRGKYLSRYLGAPGSTAQTARDAVRRRLARAETACPIEIAPRLGLNFQVHPPLTEWSLETPWEPSSPSERVLRLSDLTLRLDPGTQELRVGSRRLSRDVDLMHLGFLRDVSLPDPHFLLCALSPRLREDTVAERADLYNVLDRLALARNASLVPHRPRLEVGHVVLERARWAIPVSDFPRKSPRQSYSEYFRAISRFRRERQLPLRTFARRVGRDAPGFGLLATRMYIDWENPLALSALTRLLRNDGRSDGYLQLTESLPEPESSWLRLDSDPYAAELVVECETGETQSDVAVSQAVS
jgi:hypothetical protein